MSTKQATTARASSQTDVFAVHSAARMHYDSQKSGIDTVFRRLESGNLALGSTEIEMNSLVRIIDTLRSYKHYGLAGETFRRLQNYCSDRNLSLPEPLMGLAAEWEKMQEREKTGLGKMRAELRYTFMRARLSFSTTLTSVKNKLENHL